MQFIKDEREISIKELFFYLCSMWRTYVLSILGVALVVLVLNLKSTIKYIDILGMQVVSKELIKTMLLWIILVLLFLLGTRAIVFLFTDRIKSVNDFVTVSNIKYLGCIPIKCEVKFIIDRIILKHRGIKEIRKERDLYVDRIICVLQQLVPISITEKVFISIASSCSNDETKELFDLISEKKLPDGIEILNAGDIMNSIDAVNAVSKAKYVILAERQGKSKYSELEQTCKQLTSWNKEILGTVLLDVDAL